MKPFEFDSRNFSRHQPVRVFFHRHQLAGRIFALVGLVLVIPTHAIAGAAEQIRQNGVDEFEMLLRMAFARWKDRNPQATSQARLALCLALHETRLRKPRSVSDL